MIMEGPLLIYKKKELREKMLALRRALSTDETDKMATVSYTHLTLPTNSLV